VLLQHTPHTFHLLLPLGGLELRLRGCGGQRQGVELRAVEERLLVALAEGVLRCVCVCVCGVGEREREGGGRRAEVSVRGRSTQFPLLHEPNAEEHIHYT